MKKYYYNYLKRLYKFIVPSKATAIKISKVNQSIKKGFDYIILDYVIGELPDIQKYLTNLQKYCIHDTRIVITYYNHFWEPILKFASFMGWRKKMVEQNWLDNDDLANLLTLSGFEVIARQKTMLIPIEIPILSELVNHWIVPLPLINNLCLITYVIARPVTKKPKTYSVSIIVPARNEEGNIPKIVKRIPKFGRRQEIIFVEGHSKDKTWEKVQIETKKHKWVFGFKQNGIGKADAVRLGFSKAKEDVLMILDADITVPPSDLIKFYDAIANGYGEFINGSRLVYPMEEDAMRILNKLGNKIFSWLFTWILGQRFRDTLCGTKVLLRKDYEKIVKGRKYFGNFDPFGDYDLIFGAVKQNLKVVEIPVRYKERAYGATNISRFTHGWLLIKMTWIAFKKFKLLI
jgi:hypothetical protein